MTGKFSKAINNRTFILSLFLITTSVFFVGLSAEIAYSQSYDKPTVFQIQKKLQELGYNPGPLDGIWGKKTKTALIKFQNDNGLPMTGKPDSITKEKLGMISLEKSLTKESIPAISIQNIREALEDKWEIGSLEIKNEKLMVFPNLDVVNKQEYASMILEICREPNVSDRLKQIWILNASRNRGWVLIRAEKCNEIVDAPSTEVDKIIFRYSADVLIKTN